MPGDDLAHMGVESFLGGREYAGIGAHLARHRAPEADCSKAGSGRAPGPGDSLICFGKYFAMVAALGGDVSSETTIMHTAEPSTMGTTGRNPKTVTFTIVRSNRWPSAGKINNGGLPGPGAVASEMFCRYHVSSSQAATQRVEARAPYLVLRFQNRAAIITGAIAANAQNAHRGWD